MRSAIIGGHAVAARGGHELPPLGTSLSLLPGVEVASVTVLRPENVGSRFLSLLQPALAQTFSAPSTTAKKPNCRRHWRHRLGGSAVERYA